MTSTQETTMHLKPLAAAVLILVVLTGCSKDSRSPADALKPSAPPVAVSPADGEAGVRLDAGVTLAFAKAADRAVVERGFHLISEPDMADSLCPDTAMVHGSMDSLMMSPGMMTHMDQWHHTPGSFSWNGTSTQAVFTPQSWMDPQTRYMVHMGEEMVQMMESQMGGMGSMGGHGSGAMSGHMMLHFTTMDTTGGHDEHHK
ncbi:MAG: hypothetical protein HZC42_07970 [Candidatus Eisenbacteria bacterium]|nr:hypothetical protein [Candidatus Eisenbacteria bacterium]